MARASIRGGAIPKKNAPALCPAAGSVATTEGGWSWQQHSTFYERHRSRHGAWSKGYVPAIREAFKDVVNVQKVGEHRLAGLLDVSI